MNEGPPKYRCAGCGGEFVKAVSDEEANAEAELYFGVKNASRDERMVVVCEGCFQAMHPAKFPGLAKEARKELQ